MFADSDVDVEADMLFGAGLVAVVLIDGSEILVKLSRTVLAGRAEVTWLSFNVN